MVPSMAMARRLSILAASFALSAGVLGCDKLKALANHDGGSTAESTPAAAGLSMLSGFEGEIDIAMKTDKPPPENAMAFSLMVKSGKLRVDIPEQLAKQNGNPFGKGYAIFDSAAKKIYVVLDARKEVVVLDLNKTGEQLKGISAPREHEPHGAPVPQKPPPKVTKTGKYDTVAGYKCENWDIATDHRDGTVCVAQEGVSWFSIPMTGIPTEHLWMTELLDGKHFPLRFIGYAKDGVKEEARIEVTKIDKKTLAASDFEYPPTYQVVDLEQMLRGMMMPGGMPGAMPMPGGMPMPPHPKPH
jgi:hypothetical protein